MSERIAIVGAGMAAARLLKALVVSKPSAAITVFGNEPQLPYNRLQLSALLAGDYARDALPMLSAEWLAQHNVQMRTGDAVVALDAHTLALRCESGYSERFERIILATGARPLQPDLPGIQLQNVLNFRTLADFDCVEAVFEKRQHAPRAIVVGAGVLGLEIAHGLAQRGAKTTLIHSQQRVMNRQLDARSAQLLQAQFEARDIAIKLGCRVAALHGCEQVQAVTLSSDEQLEADLVIFAAGIAPNVEFLRDSALELDRGVMVDDCMRSSVNNIYAVGECAQFADETVGIVAPIWQQIDALIAALEGSPTKAYCTQQHGTKLKVSGIELFAIGDPDTSESAEQALLNDEFAGIYRRLVFADNRLQAAFLLGDARLSSHYEALVQEAKVLTQRQQQQLMFAAV